MIIGLTGENCAGKGTVAEYLKRKGFYYFSLSDVIREEAKSEGLEITRDNLILKGNALREKYGPGILAKKTAGKIQDDRNYVVDSIRNPAEVNEMRKLHGFLLFHITAFPKIRFERMMERGRESDPQSYEAFQKIERLELKNEQGTKQNLAETFAMADRKIENSEDLQKLYDNIDCMLGEISKEYRLKRPGWDAYFMGIAKQVSTRSNCIKRKVAAIIVKDKRIISTGYNGTPRGTRNCDEGGCPRCNNFVESGKNLEDCFCSHGEENAIVQAAYHGISVKDGTIYTTFSPCLICTKMIINSGITEVVYNLNYPIAEAPLRLLKEAGIKVRQYNIDGVK